MDGIAARGGVGKQTIYRWWPSKAAVVVDGFLDQLPLSASEPIPCTDDVTDDVLSWLRAYCAELTQPGFAELARTLTVGVFHDAKGAAFVDELVEARTNPLADRLARGQEQGEIRSDIDVSIAVDLLVGPIYSRWLLGRAPLTDDVLRAFASLSMSSLTARD